MVTALLSDWNVDSHSVVGMLIKYMFGRESNRSSLSEPPVTVIGAQFM